MATKAWIDSKEVDAALKAAEKGLADPKWRQRHLRSIKKNMKKKQKADYAAGVDPHGKPWEPIKGKKNRTPMHGRKNKLGGPKGLRTGVKQKGRVLEKSAPGWGAVHDAGGMKKARIRGSKKFTTIKVPQRELIGFSDKELKDIKEELVLWHRRSFKNMKGGKR